MCVWINLLAAKQRLVRTGVVLIIKMLVLFRLESVVTPVRLCYLCPFKLSASVTGINLSLHSDEFRMLVSMRLGSFACGS